MCKLADALAYAAKGYFIVPFSPPPNETWLVPLSEATRDPGQIRAWWQRWPNANVGVPHDKNNLVMVEVRGNERMQRLATAFLPATRAIAKAGDMTRYYFRADHKAKSETFKVGDSTLTMYGSDAAHALPPFNDLKPLEK